MRTLAALTTCLALLLSGCVGMPGGDGETVDPQSIGDALQASAAVTPASGTVDTTFTFDASNTSLPGGLDATYEWDFGDGTTGTGLVVEHVFAYDNNAYDVQLTVDVGGQSATTSIVVPVGSGVNAAPTGEMRAETGWAAKGKPITFEASGEDPDGDPVEVVWLVAKNLGEGGDGHAHSHGNSGGGGDPYGLNEAVGTGATLEYAFDDSGAYRVTASLRDPKGGATDLPVIIKVTTSPPRPTLTVTETNTLAAGTAGQGVSMVLYDITQPSGNTYIDAARYDFAVRYPGQGTIALDFAGAGTSPADLDLRLVNAESGKTVEAYENTEPAVAASGTEGGDVTLPPGTYTAYVLAKAGAQIDYTLTVDLELDVPNLDPIVVTSDAGGDDHGDGHGHQH